MKPLGQRGEPFFHKIVVLVKVHNKFGHCPCSVPVLIPKFRVVDFDKEIQASGGGRLECGGVGAWIDVMRDSVPQVPQCRDHLALMVVQRKATSAVQPFNALLDADALKISLVELARGDLGFPGYKQLVIRDRQPCLQQQFESCRQMEDSEFPLVPVVLPRIVNGGLDECPRVVEQAKRVLVDGLSGVRAQIEILVPTRRRRRKAS